MSDIQERIEAAGLTGALEVSENNIGGHTVTWPCNPNPVSRSFTPADLEAGEFERWAADLPASQHPVAATEAESEHDEPQDEAETEAPGE